MKNVAKLFFWTFLIMAGVLFLMVLSDLITPYEEIEVTLTPDFTVKVEDQKPYWDETANALGVHRDSLTIEEYLVHNSIGGPTHKEGVEELREFMQSR